MEQRRDRVVDEVELLPIDDIVKLTIFVTRMDCSAGVRKARGEFFSGDFPTSSMVEVAGWAAPSC